MLRPENFEDAAAALADASASARTVRISGGGTKAGWGAPAAEADVELSSAALDEVLEHNAGDLTAVLQAGVPLSRAQEVFRAAGQRLSLDPPLGDDGAATIGGVFATADSGPLRHRYGAPRDLALGMTVALSDGTIARSGGKVIKNVAGYDVAKLFCGSFGTLGMVLSVSVRLHPMPPARATALGVGEDADALGAAAVALARAPLELDALDVAWRGGRGGVLAQVAGAQAPRRAQAVAALMRSHGLSGIDVIEDDGTLWSQQRSGQRARAGEALVRIAAQPSALPAVLRACDAAGGTLVGRAALGTSYVALDPGALDRLTSALADGVRFTLLDAPSELRTARDPLAGLAPATRDLMCRVKLRFDPSGTCNRGLFGALEAVPA